MSDLGCRYPNSPRSPSREDAPQGDDDADDGWRWCYLLVTLDILPDIYLMKASFASLIFDYVDSLFNSSNGGISS